MLNLLRVITGTLIFICTFTCIFGSAITIVAYPIHEVLPRADYSIIVMIVGTIELIIGGLLFALAFAGLNYLFFKYKRKYDDRPVQW